ncbi:hypothetical protein ABPG75_006007 [Micractinium tetrahymenae]
MRTIMTTASCCCQAILSCTALGMTWRRLRTPAWQPARTEPSARPCWRWRGPRGRSLWWWTWALTMTRCTCCDAIIPVVNACHYSCFSTLNMLLQVLPGAIKWHAGFAPRNQKDGDYAFNPRLPRMLPFMVLNYEMKSTRVQWSASNFMETLRQIVAGEEMIDGQTVTPEVKALFVPSIRVEKGAETEQMVVPFLRYLKHLPVAHECGRAFFDLSKENMNDYYAKAMRELESSMDQINAEKRYVGDRFKALAQNLIRFATLPVPEIGVKGKKRPAAGAADGAARRKGTQPARG